MKHIRSVNLILLILNTTGNEWFCWNLNDINYALFLNTFQYKHAHKGFEKNFKILDLDLIK